VPTVTCAKKRVVVYLHSKDGRVFVGENLCRNPQSACPRAPGEGYEKCKSVCDQVGHAEMNALAAAGDAAIGATVLLVGHHHYCRACQEALFDAGVSRLMRNEGQQ
jgi:deoxycytidylate deaminase